MLVILSLLTIAAAAAFPSDFALVFYFGFAISFVPVDSIRLDDFSLCGSLVGRMSMESAGGGVIPMDIELSSDSLPIDGYASGAEDSIMSIDVDANMCAIHSSTALNARGVCLRCMTEQSSRGRRSSKKGRRKNKLVRCEIHKCFLGKAGICPKCTAAENNDASLSTPIPAEKLCPIHNCHADTNGLCRLCDVPAEMLYREPKKCPIHDCLAEQNGLCRECVG